MAQARGQACSFINEESYARYDRDLFLATLNDWDWFGDPADAPGWYTGRPWTGRVPRSRHDRAFAPGPDYE